MIKHTKAPNNKPALLNEMGYSLITTAIVIATIGLIITALSSMYFIYERKKNTIETQEVMTTARKGIERFISIKGYLPCPAPLSAAQDSQYYNTERKSGSSCRTATFSGITSSDGIATVNGYNDSSKKVHIGALPARTLGLPDTAAFDAYGRRIIYAVSADYTESSTADFKAANGQIELSLGQDINGDGSNDSALKVDGTAIYLILSPGQDNRGAYSVEGKLIEPCNTSSFAGENCDFDDAIFNVSMNRNYGNSDDRYTNNFFYRASLNVYSWEVSYGSCTCFQTVNGVDYFKTKKVNTSCKDNQGNTVSNSYCKSVKPSTTPVDCSGSSQVDNCLGWKVVASYEEPTCPTDCGTAASTIDYKASGIDSFSCNQRTDNDGSITSTIYNADDYIECYREGMAKPVFGTSPYTADDFATKTKSCNATNACVTACSGLSGIDADGDEYSTDCYGNNRGSGGGGGGGGGGGHYYDSNGDGITDTYSNSPGYGTDNPGVSTNYSGYTSGARDQGNRGSGSSGGGSSRVICTHFYRRKRLPHDLYWADIEYTMLYINPFTVRGYHVWGIPVVRMLRKNDQSLLGKFMWFITHHRAEELGYQMGIRSKPNYIGKAVRLIFEPTCFVIGLFFTPEDYKSLYHKSELRRFKKEYHDQVLGYA